MKKKVMHLISHLKMGGAETLITNYALKIDKNKFDFIIVIISEKSNSINEQLLKENGIKIISLGESLKFPSNTKNIFKKIFNKIHRHILFKRIVNKEKPDIIHSHLQVNEYLIPINVNRLKIKLFYTFHTEVSAILEKGKFKFKFITNYLIKKKGMVPIALHEEMRREVNNLFKIDNTVVLHNGIDMERFNTNLYDKNKILKSLNINDNNFIIGHIGRFSEVKNHQFIIRVFREVKNKIPNAHLILVGTGELENKIKADVEQFGLMDCVSFLGNRSDIPELLSVMDVFLFPSHFEGTGIALIEAQAMGLKCVVSEGIPQEAIVNNNVFTLSLNKPIKEWCECILEENTNNVDKKNEERLKKYDLNVIIKKLEKIYSGDAL